MICTKSKWRCLPVFMFLLFASGMSNAVEQNPESKIRAKLKAPVRSFDNQNKPLIPTLLKIAADYHLPMGIEKVVKEAVEKPITVKLHQGTVAQLLDLAVAQLPGYSWASREGAIHIYGAEEMNQPSNLLNQILPYFTVKNETLDDANMKLRQMFFAAVENLGGAYVGSYIGTPGLGEKRISLTMRNSTVRSILNRLAALHGEAVWISIVNPERLSQKPLPRAGLWRFLPRMFQDPTGLLDIR